MNCSSDSAPPCLIFDGVERWRLGDSSTGEQTLQDVELLGEKRDLGLELGVFVLQFLDPLFRVLDSNFALFSALPDGNVVSVPLLPVFIGSSVSCVFLGLSGSLRLSWCRAESCEVPCRYAAVDLDHMGGRGGRDSNAIEGRGAWSHLHLLAEGADIRVFGTVHRLRVREGDIRSQETLEGGLGVD